MPRRETYRTETSSNYIIRFVEDDVMIHSRQYKSAWFADREARNWLLHNGYVPIPQKRIEEHYL